MRHLTKFGSRFCRSGSRFYRFADRSKKAIALPLLALLIWLIAAFPVPGPAAGQTGTIAVLFSAVNEVDDGAPSSTGFQEYIRSRPVLVDLALLGQADGNGAQLGRSLVLNLFAESNYTAVPAVVESSSPGKLTWEGTIDGKSDGTAIFTVVGEAAAGTVQVDGRLFRLSYAGDGRHLITEAGPNDPMPEYPPVVVPGVDDGQSGSANPDGEEKREANKVVDGDDGSVIDVLVAYTPAARVNRGGTAAMKAHIDLAIAETNQAYQNSQIYTRLNLVLAAEVNYSESGDIVTDLSRLQSNSDGYMDEVHGWRDSFKADMVSLINVDTTFCGIGYLMTGLPPNSPNFESFAFNVVHVTCATGYYSFGHELGHNMGSAHDRANAGISLSNYSFGYQAPNRAFRTIMSYNCLNGGCPRVRYFSNPWVSYGGQPTGIDYNSNPANAADNARSINEARFTVANWRVSSPPLPDPPLAPDSLVANSTSFHEINLSWTNHATNADGITLERRPEGGSWKIIALIVANQSSYHDLGLPGQSSYQYRVRAFNLGGNSAYSNIAGGTTFPAPYSLFIPHNVR